MFKTLVEKLFAQVASIEIDPNLIEIPQDRSMGDFALPCFSFAKELKKAPNVIAQEIADHLKPEGIIAKIQALGPYVNVSLDTALVTNDVLGKVLEQGEEYARSLANHEKMIIESPGPNTNKPLHLGHVRNMLLGNALADIAAFAGYDVHKVDIVNDRGIHICKSMLAYQKFGNNEEPNKKADHYVGDWYVRYDQESKQDPSLDEEIKQMLLKREDGDEETRALRLKMRDRALDGMHETYKRYGCHIEKAYFESDHYLKGKKIVDEGIESELFRVKENGNIVFEDDELGEKVVLRSDGTSIYITQDIALGILRFEDWKMDRMVYVVGNEQADHFKFLFRIFEKMGLEFASKCHHLSYGMISLPDGKMKSREGNVVDADTLIDEIQDISLNQLKQRYPDEDHTNLAEQIAFAAIKFFVLKYDAKKDFVFDRKESLSFDGESGPYIQYTYARCRSILAKAKEQGISYASYEGLSNDSERLLCLHLAEFAELVQKSAHEYKPSLVARYVLELARMFNAYYQQSKILVEDDPAGSQSRLALVASVQQVLHTGLKLLGIEAPERM